MPRIGSGGAVVNLYYILLRLAPLGIIMTGLSCQSLKDQPVSLASHLPMKLRCSNHIAHSQVPACRRALWHYPQLSA